MSGVDGIGSLPAGQVQCSFEPRGFDLTILGLKGANLRLLRTNLAGEIVPAKSAFRVRRDGAAGVHVVVSSTRAVRCVMVRRVRARACVCR